MVTLLIIAEGFYTQKTNNWVFLFGRTFLQTSSALLYITYDLYLMNRVGLVVGRRQPLLLELPPDQVFFPKYIFTFVYSYYQTLKTITSFQ